MPDATPTSIDPPSPARRNKAWIAAQFVITAIVVWYVGKKLVTQWMEFRGTPIEVHPRWGMIVLSSIIALSGHATLIETWRRMIMSWGDRFDFIDAARIWSISNLGRYVPGKVWGIGVMAEMARRQQVSAAAAAGSSIINTAVNLACGVVVAVLAGWSAMDALSGGRAVLVAVLGVSSLIGLFALPVLLPSMLAIVRRVTGRNIGSIEMPRRTIYVSIIGNLVAWMLYGLAFQVFVAGVIGVALGTLRDYVAVYASSYVLGYLALAFPGGIGVREGFLIQGLQLLHLANVGQATVIAVTSRLWITVLEIVPALLFLARGKRPRPQAMTARDGTKS